jgi:hypothetical protein
MKASNGLAFELATSNSAVFSKIDRMLKKL